MEKKCKKCQVNKDLSEFRERKTKKGTKYILGTCKKCENEYATRYNREVLGQAPRASLVRPHKYINDILHVQCRYCKEYKTTDNFHKQTSKSVFGIQANCKECRSKKRRADLVKLENGSEKFKRKVFLNIKRRAKLLNIEFSITENDIIVPKICPYLGIELTYDGDRNTSPSVDKIDNSKGYVKGNIQVISTLANMMKRDASIQLLKTFATNILKLHS